MLEITTDPKRIDFDYVYRYISNSYWAKGRSTETLKTCIENSLNFSLYLNRRQIGYARIVTDYAVFAYLMDVFIDEEHRKKGYATNLLHYILHFDKLKTIEVWRLATTDAQELYKKIGFGLLENPDTMMELKKNLNQKPL